MVNPRDVGSAVPPFAQALRTMAYFVSRGMKLENGSVEFATEEQKVDAELLLRGAAFLDLLYNGVDRALTVSDIDEASEMTTKANAEISELLSVGVNKAAHAFEKPRPRRASKSRRLAYQLV